MLKIIIPYQIYSSDSSKSVEEYEISRCERIKDAYLTPYAKITSRWIKDLNIRPWTVKILKENIGNKASWHCFWQWFIGENIKSISKQSKIRQVGLYQTRNRNHQQSEKRPMLLKKYLQTTLCHLTSGFGFLTQSILILELGYVSPAFLKILWVV